MEESNSFFDQEITDAEKEKYFEFSTTGYLIINKKLLKTFGPLGAIFISNLIDKFLYFLKMGKLTKEGTFFHTHQQQMDEIYLKEETVRKLKKLFVYNGIIETKMKGSPSKEHYKINIYRLEKMIKECDSISPQCSSGSDGSQGLALDEGQVHITNINTNDLKEGIINNTLKDSLNPNKSSFKQILSRRTIFNPNPKTKSSKEPPKDFFTSQDWRIGVLNVWNSLPDVHKHKNISSKVIKRIGIFLNLLNTGAIADRCKINDDFLEKNNIPSDWLYKSRKFTPREIISALNTYKKHLTNGYFPNNKNNLPKNLDEFIYYSETGSSWFLKCVANPDPKPIAEERKMIDPNPQYTKLFKERGLLKHFEEKDYPSIYQEIQRLKNKIIEEKIIDFSSPNPTRNLVIGQEGQFEPMFKGYAQYLNNKNQIYEPDNIFYFYGKDFQEYLESLRNDYRFVNNF